MRENEDVKTVWSLSRTVVSAVVVAVAVGGCTSGHSGTAASDENRLLWRHAEPSSYSFTVVSRCGERAFLGRFAVSVRDGEVIKVEGLDAAARSMIDHGFAGEVKSIDDMLVELDAARREDADLAQAVFAQSDHGIPSSWRYG